MRGKGFPTVPFFVFRRITPAYAGKRRRRLRRHCESEDHPRLCGEKITQSPTQNTHIGSPPPMRGKAYMPLWMPPLSRITPAYAGKRPRLLSEIICWKDHPRLCGEKAAFRFSVEICLGSPPPMRGKGCRSYCIPCTYRDHPRLCGEKRSTIIRNTIPKGSPPPMRGKAATHGGGSASAGITPAYAGKRG